MVGFSGRSDPFFLSREKRGDLVGRNLAPELVHLSFLGSPQIRLSNRPVHFESGKITALLAYLALQGNSCHRQKLMLYFWGGFRQERATANLRRALWEIRRKLSFVGEPEIIETSAQEVRFNRRRRHWLDVQVFEEAGRETGSAADLQSDPGWPVRLEQALALYQGDFLENLTLEDAPEFDDWARAEKDRLRLLAIQLSIRLARYYLSTEAPAKGLHHAKRILQWDPLEESGHRLVMEILARQGQTAAALRQYDLCHRLLAEQLQISPSADTNLLLKNIRLQEQSAPASPGAGQSASTDSSDTSLRHNLPQPGTPFVGRHADLEVILRSLRDPACRLLTLLGPGGIGKTRLALESGRILATGHSGSALFPDGIWFVSVPESQGGQALEFALATALAQRFHPSESPRDQVIRFLTTRKTLLLLDAMEHRMEEIRLLTDLLHHCPGLTMLVTTRERLRLKEEWVLDIKGFPAPGHSSATEPSEPTSADLFLACARRVQPDFGLGGPGGVNALHAVCRMVDGSPLAIELAAAFTRFLTLEEIECRVRSSLDFLTAHFRETTERKVSLKAVFDSAWERLSAGERKILCRLSVFRGGFSLAAGEYVAQTGLDVIAGLHDKSLLQHSAEGRFQLHELIRHYAERKREETGTEGRKAQIRHAGFFSRFLLERYSMMLGAEPQVHGREVEKEIENIRAAWEWAMQERRISFLRDAMEGFSAFCEWKGWLQEGVEKLNRIGDLLPAPPWRGPGYPSLQSKRLLFQGRLLNRMGCYARAAEVLNACLAHLQSYPDAETAAWALFHLGDSAQLEGKYEEARRYLQKSIAASRHSDHTRCSMEALSRLGRVSMELGDQEEARSRLLESLAVARKEKWIALMIYTLSHLGYVDYFRNRLNSASEFLLEALHLARHAGDRPSMVWACLGLGYIAEHDGDFCEARRCYQEGLEVAGEIGDTFSKARAVMLLGECDRRSGSFREAIRHYTEALTAARSIGSRFLVAINLGNLGLAFSALGDVPRARRYVQESLEVSCEIGGDVVLLQAVIAYASLSVSKGDFGRARELLTAVLHHPATRSDLRMEAESILLRIPPSETGSSALRPGKGKTLDRIAHELEAGLRLGSDRA